MNNRKKKLIKKYKKIYDDIDKLYNDDNDYTLKECCKKKDVTTCKYYRICKELDYKSVVGQYKIQPFEIKKNKKKNNKMSGGSKDDDKKIYKLTEEDIIKLSQTEQEKRDFIHNMFNKKIANKKK